MLVLSRKPDETIHIGDAIKIVVVKCSDHQCRLAIEAPRELRIWRGELVQPPRPAAATPAETAPSAA